MGHNIDILSSVIRWDVRPRQNEVHLPPMMNESISALYPTNIMYK